MAPTALHVGAIGRKSIAAPAKSPRGSRPSPRHRGTFQSQNRPGSQGRNQGKGPTTQAQGGRGNGRRRSRRGKATVEEQVSPFQSYTTPSSWTTSTTPFPSTTNQNSTTTTPAQAPINEEILAHLQEAYQDKEMPLEVKSAVEKAQANQRKSVIKGLHSATKELDRASKRLSDAIQERQKHRSQWMQHLEESVQLWQTQLASYKKRQVELREEATQAQKDVLAARQSINEQNAQALPAKGKPASLPAAATHDVLDLTGDADAEEEVMQRKLQSLLEQCASTVGVDGGSSGFAPSTMLDISSDDGKMHSKPKRARSAEPLS